MRRRVVVEVAGTRWVGGDVVEMSTALVAGARHATRDGSRCAGHSRRRRRVARRCVAVLLGTQRRAVRVSSLQPHRRRRRLSGDDDLPGRRQKRRGHQQRVARHLRTALQTATRRTNRRTPICRVVARQRDNNHKLRSRGDVILANSPTSFLTLLVIVKYNCNS